jgi:hypothetical protein
VVVLLAVLAVVVEKTQLAVTIQVELQHQVKEAPVETVIRLGLGLALAVVAVLVE